MSAQGSLAGKVALVTGGSRGIGLGIATALHEAGAHVVSWGRSAVAGDPDPAAPILDSVDVADEAAVAEGISRVIDRFGRIDAVFACAGISGSPTPFLRQSGADWRSVFDVNVFGLVNTMRSAVGVMVEAGHGGSLVGFSSLSAAKGAPGMQPYAASKAATEAIMRGLAVEFGSAGIRANTIAPGWTETDLTRSFSATQGGERIALRTPAGRWGQPADIASLAVYLAGDAARFITGATLVIDGGYSVV